MFSSPDFAAKPFRRRVRAWHLAEIAVVMLAAGCASPFGQPDTDAANEAETPAVVATLLPGLPLDSVGAVGPAAPLATEAVVRMLAYADLTRRMQPAELSQEVIRLGDVVGPTEELQLALVLSQFHQSHELMRAQELLGRVLTNVDTEAQALHPLAGLLAGRLGEQRRLEDQLEKQTQQTREVQRRLDHTNERLAALKAIERSLTIRAPAANSRDSNAPAP